MDVQLRAYVLVDSMQPQAAAHVASTSQGDVPIAGMSELLIEVAPGNHIFRCTDIALKAANVRPAFQIVEREFGLLEIHSATQTEVEAAGEAILEHLGLKVEDRIRPKIASTQMITNVTPYQAQLINKWRKGSLLLPKSTLFILETAPAAYISLAGNEAEKAADISLIEVRAVGRFGRLFIAGLESDVEAAAKAAVAAIEAIGARMSVISVADIDQASGKIVVSPRDIVTPLARDRAKERGIAIEVRSSSSPAQPGRGAQRNPFAGPEPAMGRQPMSGALYRRGAAVPASLEIQSKARDDARPKVAVVGAGHVGAMTALRLAETSLFSTATLIDIAPGLAAGLALDMWHSSSLRGFDTRIEGTEDLAGLKGARYVVVTAGRPRQPGMSRTDLTAVNAQIIEQVADGIKAHAKDAVVVVVTNPLEEMTALTAKVTGFPERRVIGMAGVLDSARFCSLIALTGVCDPRDVLALALGSHGPEMVIPLSNAKIRGRPIAELVPADQLRSIVERARDSGAEVVGLLKKGSAYFSPAESAAAMVCSMVQGRGNVIAACVRSEGSYGLVDTRVGLPVKLGRDGVAEIVQLELTADERSALATAAKSIQIRIAALDA